MLYNTFPKHRFQTRPSRLMFYSIFLLLFFLVNHCSLRMYYEKQTKISVMTNRKATYKGKVVFKLIHNPQSYQAIIKVRVNDLRKKDLMTKPLSVFISEVIDLVEVYTDSRSIEFYFDYFVLKDITSTDTYILITGTNGGYDVSLLISRDKLTED